MKTKGKVLMLLLCLALVAGLAAKDKPWTEWTKKDAEKVLNDSGWGQSQTESNITEMTYSPASRDIAGQGALNQATTWTYRARFISAKPIRQALARLTELEASKFTPQQLEAARDFIDRKFDDVIVVAVTFEGKDQRFTNSVFTSFSNAITSTMKNNTYLELKGGKRLFLQEYQPPSGDGLGAKFIFARFVDDQPFINPKSGDVRFYAEFPRLAGNNEDIILNMKFKVSNMMYEGKIEF